MIGDRLPPLEELVARVPPSVLAILDDLFRAKFTGVRRIAAPEGASAEATPGVRGGQG